MTIDYDLELELLRHWAFNEHEWRFDVTSRESVCFCGARRRLDEVVKRLDPRYAQKSEW